MYPSNHLGMMTPDGGGPMEAPIVELSVPTMYTCTQIDP